MCIEMSCGLPITVDGKSAAGVGGCGFVVEAEVLPSPHEGHLGGLAPAAEDLPQFLLHGDCKRKAVAFISSSLITYLLYS